MSERRSRVTDDVICHVATTRELISEKGTCVAWYVPITRVITNSAISRERTTVSHLCNFFSSVSWKEVCEVKSRRRRWRRSGVLTLISTTHSTTIFSTPKSVARASDLNSWAAALHDDDNDDDDDDNDNTERPRIIPKGRSTCVYLNSRGNYRFCY